MTQTLHVIYDIEAAVRGTRDLLAPRTACCSRPCPASARSARDGRRDWGDWWRFTTDSARRLFGDVYGAENVEVEAHGNVLVRPPASFTASPPRS